MRSHSSEDKITYKDASGKTKPDIRITNMNFFDIYDWVSLKFCGSKYLSKIFKDLLKILERNYEEYLYKILFWVRSLKEILLRSSEEWDLIKAFILLKIFKRKFWRRTSYLHTAFLAIFQRPRHQDNAPVPAKDRYW